MVKSVFRLDLTGQRFGRWSVISFSHKNSGGERYWNCRCDCGAERPVKANGLTSGRSTSCGCYHRETVSMHGMTGKPTFISWLSLKGRCLNPESPDYHRYGGRGIKVCERWANSFDAFVSDMGHRPEGTTLDRIDVNGNYEPGNCQWSSASRQQRNRRDTRMATFRDITKCLSDWEDETGIPASVLGWRLENGWTAEKALTTLKRRKRR